MILNNDIIHYSKVTGQDLEKLDNILQYSLVNEERVIKKSLHLRFLSISTKILLAISHINTFLSQGTGKKVSVCIISIRRDRYSYNSSSILHFCLR